MALRTHINKLTHGPVGRTLYAPFKSLLHLYRRMAHPGVPPDRSVALVSSGGRTFSIQCRRWGPSDRMAVQECFEEAQYNVPTGPQAKLVDRTYRSILASGRKPLIVDCGANIGASVLWFTARYPEAHIVAVEPAPDNAEVLRANVQGLDVDIRQAGIGAENGEAWLANPGDWGMGYQTNTSQQGFRVDIISLGSILDTKPASQYTPFLLKVDIEGAEKSLFSAHYEVLNRFPIIVMEPHDWMEAGQPTCLEFFRFHVENGREFDMNHEIVASMAFDPALTSTAGSVFAAD